MLPRPRVLVCVFVFVLIFLQVPFLHCAPADSWKGALRDAAGNPVGMATVKLVSADSKREYSAATSASGQFAFAGVAAGEYTVAVGAAGKIWTTENRVSIKDDGARTYDLQLTQQGQELKIGCARAIVLDAHAIHIRSSTYATRARVSYRNHRECGFATGQRR